jgi:hypothetical protein
MPVCLAKFNPFEWLPRMKVHMQESQAMKYPLRVFIKTFNQNSFYYISSTSYRVKSKSAYNIGPKLAPMHGIRRPHSDVSLVPHTNNNSQLPKILKKELKTQHMPSIYLQRPHQREAKLEALRLKQPEHSRGLQSMTPLAPTNPLKSTSCSPRSY